MLHDPENPPENPVTVGPFNLEWAILDEDGEILRIVNDRQDADRIAAQLIYQERHHEEE